MRKIIYTATDARQAQADRFDTRAFLRGIDEYGNEGGFANMAEIGSVIGSWAGRISRITIEVDDERTYDKLPEKKTWRRSGIPHTK